MKTEYKVILASIALGIFIWIADSLIDYLFFFEGTFTGLLLTNIPTHEMYIRILILGCFTLFGFLCSRLITSQKETAKKLESSLFFQQQLLDSVPVPIFYKNEKYVYSGCNKSFEEFMGMNKKDLIGKSVHDIAPPELASVYHEKDFELINNPGVQIYEFEIKSKTNDSNRKVIFHKATFEKQVGKVAGIIGAILDITELKQTENENKILITQLQEALDKVKLLSGFIPICASCKNIRDDKGFWNKMESYISEHSEAEFSHSICPDCAKKLYPEYIGDNSEK